jgi:xanthine dehydrogenase iron-sulfur cluster and FAD-binding subunit A
MAKMGANFSFAEKPSLLFGGISAAFFHAKKTEEFLAGKSLTDVATVIGACAALKGEVSRFYESVSAEKFSVLNSRI